ncbi:TlpA disulfide reductase family protein [Bacteroidota bacterium]
MKKGLLTILFVPIFFFASLAQEAKVIKVTDLERMIHSKEEGISVINFWATWCKPCVMEMPYFEALNQSSDYPEVTVQFISVDFVENLESKVKKFIRKKNIKSEVFLIDNIDYNSWIDKVDKSWSGAIPATLIIHGQSGKRKFYEKEFKEGELEKIVNEFRTSL